MPIKSLKHICFVALHDTQGLSENLSDELFRFRHARKYRRVVREAVVYSFVRRHHMMFEGVLDELMDWFYSDVPSLACGECGNIDDSCTCAEAG